MLRLNTEPASCLCPPCVSLPCVSGAWTSASPACAFPPLRFYLDPCCYHSSFRRFLLDFPDQARSSLIVCIVSSSLVSGLRRARGCDFICLLFYCCKERFVMFRMPLSRWSACVLPGAPAARTAKADATPGGGDLQQHPKGNASGERGAAAS